MNSIKTVLIIFLFLFSFFTNAQDEKLPSYFSDQSYANTAQFQGNNINNLHRSSEEVISTISLKQVGNQNAVNIYNELANGTHNVYQIGDGNNYQFLNYRNNHPVNLSIFQAGDDNLLKILGTNSMFQNLKISQFGGAKMSIINY